jgi:phosphatidylserine synthase 2
MFWRMIHGMGILYLLFMIYLLNMDIHAARAWIRTFSPELKNEVAPPENTRIYATDCRLGTTGDPRGPFYVFWDTSFDIFFVAHFVGWIGKAIVFRDMKLTLTLSVMWEVVEYSFQHILGNFHECWWDHWILDVGLANLGGLLVGLYLNHRLEMRSYDWTGDFPHGQTPSPRHVTFSDVITRLLQQFTPRSWDVYAWNVFSSVSRCMAVVALVFVAEMVELSGFFMKYILWVPPSNLLNTYRLLIWGFLTIPSVREWYAYINDSTVKRPGPNVWLAWFIIAIEYAFIFKHSEEWMGGAGGKDTPWEVMMGWGLFLLLGLTYIVSKFGPMHICKGLWSSTEYDTFRQVHAWATNALLCITFLPLAWMCYRLDVGYGTHYDSHIQHGYAPYFHYNGSQLATPHGHPRLVD